MKKESLQITTIKTLLAVLLFAGIGTIIFGGGCIIWEYSKTQNSNKIIKESPDEWRVCSQDSDCVGIRLGCACYIENAINKIYLDDWTNILQERCGDNCIMDLGLRLPSDNTINKAVCENSRCELRQEKEISCAKSGEFVNPDSLKGKTNYPDVCCEGLKGVGAYKVNEDGECEAVEGTPYLTCVPCGNGVCDEIDLWFENKCNCPEDCGDESDTSDWQTYRNEEFGFEVKYPEEWIKKNIEDVHFDIQFRKDISFDHPRRFTEININMNKNSKNLSLEEIISDFENTDRVYEQKEYITINNEKVFKAEIANWGMVSGKQFLIIGEKYWYDIVVDGTNVEDVEINQILYTFKFTKN